jgi:hypothetical protein
MDPTVLSDAELSTLVAQLEQEEKQLSKRRDALHRRIDFVRAGGGGHDTASAELLDSISGEEKHVSKERQSLQRRIDTLRSEQLRRHASR